MDKINLLIVSRVGMHRSFFDTVASLDPRLSVKDCRRQFISWCRHSGKMGAMVDLLEREASLGYDREIPGVHEDFKTLLAEADIVYANLLLPDNLPLLAPRLKWVHLGGAGLESFKPSGIFQSDILVTNSRGAVAVPIAEHVFGFIFMLAKNASRLLENKQKKLWIRLPSWELDRRTVCIIGLGAIGSEVARLAKGLGMKVIATRRSAVKRECNAMGVDEIYPSSELHQMLSQSDFVVITAALTAETEGLIGENELRMMKPTSYLINVARGQIVQQPVLVRALREGWIAGAGLDVFEVEPLPADDELWSLPNVIVSSHDAGATDRWDDRVLNLFCDNVKRYMKGEPLRNIVDKTREY